MAEQFLCQKQLARRWGISHRTLENWRYRGQGLPFLRLGGKIFYKIEEVEAYETRQTQPGFGQAVLFEDVTVAELGAGR